MLKFGNREFNNLQEQVLVNANGIEEIKQSLGTALPNPIAGPQGPRGEIGPQGVAGTHAAWTIGTDLPASANLGDIHLLWNGDVYQFTKEGWVLELNIRGSQGVEGPRGFTGPKGDRGEKGEKGDRGAVGPVFKVKAELSSFGKLPKEGPTEPNEAYIIGDQIYCWIAEEWDHFPLFATTTANGVVSTPVNLLSATNVQEAIEQLSDASYISVEPYNEDYSSDVANHMYELAANIETNAEQITSIRNNMLKTAPLNGDGLQVGSYISIGMNITTLNAFDILEVSFSTSKQLTSGVALHPGVYYFRKMGFKTSSNGIDHIVYELAYTSSTHSLADRNVSVFIEMSRTLGATLSYMISPEDKTVVHKSGTESISGAKTFSNLRVNTVSGGTTATITTDANYIYIGRVGNTQDNLLKIDANTGQIAEIGDIAAVLDMINGEV